MPAQPPAPGWGHLIDPFCGSGTILIEGRSAGPEHRPGGWGRAFTAGELGAASPGQLWQQERERARSLERRDTGFTAQGFDVDPAAVELTLANAQKGRGWGTVSPPASGTCGTSPKRAPYGCVVCNPPYGERLLDVRQAQELYRALGQVFQPRRGWSLGVISPDPEFESLFGRKADKRRKLYNGMIQCQYYQYFRGK